MSNKETYILFIDESGKSKLTDDGDVFYLTGLIINKNLHTALSSYMLSLKHKSMIPGESNLHAFDLFENEKINNRRVSYKNIDAFLDRLLKLVEGTEMYSSVVVVKKSNYLKKIAKTAHKQKSTIKAVASYLKRNGLEDFLYEALVRKLILQFGHFLHEKDANGEIVAESRRDGDHAVVNGFINATKSNRYMPNTINNLWSQHCFNRIYGLTFQNKKGLSYGLEIADMFAWTTFNLNYYNQHRAFPRPFASKTKLMRTLNRLHKIQKIRQSFLVFNKGKSEEITEIKMKHLALDLVSKFNNLLKLFRSN